MAERDMETEARDGNVYAMLSLAYLYHHGIDYDCDPEKAIYWYKQSASNGCARAKWELAKLYRNGDLVTSNEFEYIHWLSAAADSDIPEAQVALAKRYYLGILVPKDMFMFRNMITRSARLGYPTAEYYLGYCYKKGIAVEQDQAKADAYMNRASQHGDADLFFRIGKASEFGHEPIQKDVEEAIRWYTKAADMGSERAYYSLKRLKEALSGRRPDTEEQRNARLANLPISEDEFERQDLLDKADATLEDGNTDEALELYRTAADKGNSDAMYMLSLMYHEGGYVKRNDQLALNYLTQAAYSGNTVAEMELGRFYEYGYGFPKDLDEALRFYAMAVANGYLAGYFDLSRHMKHPEKFVREKRMVVR